MPRLVANAAQLICDQGVAPGTLTVVPRHVSSDQMQLANVEDHTPIVNIPSFGMCLSLVNPQVMAATAAAGGVLTPAPCIPMTYRPWENPSAFLVEKLGARDVPLLLEFSSCPCDWMGRITVIEPNCDQTSDG